MPPRPSTDTNERVANRAQPPAGAELMRSRAQPFGCRYAELVRRVQATIPGAVGVVIACCDFLPSAQPRPPFACLRVVETQSRPAQSPRSRRSPRICTPSHCCSRRRHG